MHVMGLDRLLHLASDLAVIRIALTIVGLGLAAMAVILLGNGLLQKKRLKTPDAVAILVILFLGGGLSAFAHFGIQPPKQAQNSPIFPDIPPPPEEVNEAALAQLKTASLASDRPSLASGQDWPQWMGPNRNGVSPCTGINVDWKREPPALLWKHPVGRGFSSLAVANGLVYTLDFDGKGQERVWCLDAQDGRDIWCYQYPADSKTGGYAGPRATPTVHDGKVYTVGADGLLLCLDANPADGHPKVIWQHDLMAEFKANRPGHGVACSPLIEGNLVVVQPGGKDASIVAFDRETGSVAWRAYSDPAGYSSPVAATAAGIRQIICFTGRGMAGVTAAEGKPLWHRDWPTGFDVNAATPVVAGDYVFLSSGYGSGCALYHLVASQDGVKPEAVYVKHGKLMRNHHMTSILRDGYLYGCDDNGRNSLKCVNLRTAQEQWDSEKIGKHCLIYADGHLIALNEEGTLVLVEANPKEFHEDSRLEGVLRGPECWALPAMAAGRLYLRDHHNIVCLDLREKRRAAQKR
jgi:outer membrane protein assembly factor BamB